MSSNPSRGLHFELASKVYLLLSAHTPASGPCLHTAFQCTILQCRCTCNRQDGGLVRSARSPTLKRKKRVLCSAARNHGRKDVGLPSRMASFDSSDSLPKGKQQSWWHKQSEGILKLAPAHCVCCCFHTNVSDLCCFYTSCSTLCLIFWQSHCCNENVCLYHDILFVCIHQD